jgi:hypothetical protein
MSELRAMLSSQAKLLEEQSARIRQQQALMEQLAGRVAALSSRPEATEAPKALAPSSTLGHISREAHVPSPTTVATAVPSALQASPSAQSQQDLFRIIDERIARVGPFTFSGDLRLRDEPFFGGPSNQSLNRHRVRIRARFNVNARLNEEISGGLSVASGHLGDAISANQDLDQFFTRKAFDLERAFVTYTPQWFRPLTVTAGKFGYPWYRTELVWDNDVTLEGVAATLNFAVSNQPVLRRVALVGFALPFGQTRGVNSNIPPGTTDRSVRQSMLYGGQLQTEWQLTERLKLSGYTAFYNWHNADPIAHAALTATSAGPLNGLQPLDFDPQNSITSWTQSATVPAIAGGATEVNTSIANAQFGSKFGLLDVIARLDIATASPKWPVTLLADFVYNTKACANIAGFLVPTPAPGATITASTNAPCDPRQRQGYWFEGRLGRTAEQGDWQFAYTRMYIEREAVLGAWTFSDLRQASNVSQHRIETFYHLYRNVQLGFIGLIGKPLEVVQPGETWLKRLQFDVLYRF